MRGADVGLRRRGRCCARGEGCCRGRGRRRKTRRRSWSRRETSARLWCAGGAAEQRGRGGAASSAPAEQGEAAALGWRGEIGAQGNVGVPNKGGRPGILGERAQHGRRGGDCGRDARADEAERPTARLDPVLGARLLEGSRCAGNCLVGPRGRGRSTGRGRMSGAELRDRSASGHHGGEEGPDWWALAVRRCGRSARWLSGEVAPTSGAGLSGRTRASGRGSCAWNGWQVGPGKRGARG